MLIIVRALKAIRVKKFLGVNWHCTIACTIIDRLYISELLNEPYNL